MSIFTLGVRHNENKSVFDRKQNAQTTDNEFVQQCFCFLIFVKKIIQKTLKQAEF